MLLIKYTYDYSYSILYKDKVLHYSILISSIIKTNFFISNKSSLDPNDLSWQLNYNRYFTTFCLLIRSFVHTLFSELLKYLGRWELSWKGARNALNFILYLYWKMMGLPFCKHASSFFWSIVHNRFYSWEMHLWSWL